MSNQKRISGIIMVRKRLVISVTVLLFFSMLSMAEKDYKYNLQHMKGINSVGLRVGTGWGNGLDLGFTYQHYFHKIVSLVINTDYEQSYFKKKDESNIRQVYTGPASKMGRIQQHNLTLCPGVEICFVQPCNWLYMHFTAGGLLAYDDWYDASKEGWYTISAYNWRGAMCFSLGVFAGFNMEFYCIPQFSIVLSAEQRWRHMWNLYGDALEKNNYFNPLFSVGFKYNIL